MNVKTRRMPAEWEVQSCVQLTWPHEGTDWGPMLPEVTAVYEVMAHEIAKREALVVVSPHPLTLTADRYQTFLIRSNDTWARDHGFITVVEEEQPAPTTQHPSPNTQHPTPTTLLLDFCFNGWGEKFEASLDNAINRQLWEQGAVKGCYESHLDFVLEGGSIESDGQGTVFTTRCCLMAPHRNQPLTQQQIEDRLKAYLGAERVVWLNHGSLLGDDTDGHIDTMVRVCPHDTLLYIGGDETHPALYDLEHELQNLRTLDGKPYRLLRLPLPRPIYDAGERLPATYANYLVVNGAVLVPTYAQPDLDSEAMNIVRQAYPKREVVGIDCRALIRQHGSLHCCTMQYY